MSNKPLGRYIVVHNLDAIAGRYPGFEEMQEDYNRYGDTFWCLYETDGEKPIRFVGDDAMEPEDATFVQDLSWLVEELNKVSKGWGKGERDVDG